MKRRFLGIAMFAAATFLVSACGASTDCHKGDSCSCDASAVTATCSVN